MVLSILCGDKALSSSLHSRLTTSTVLGTKILTRASNMSLGTCDHLNAAVSEADRPQIVSR